MGSKGVPRGGPNLSPKLTLLSPKLTLLSPKLTPFWTPPGTVYSQYTRSQALTPIWTPQKGSPGEAQIEP